MYYDLSTYRDNRKIKPSESTLNRSAKRKETKASLYMDKLIKQVPSDNIQAGHKPYGNDIKLM